MIKYLSLIMVLAVSISCSSGDKVVDQSEEVEQLQEEKKALVKKTDAQHRKYLATQKAMLSYQTQKNQQILQMAKLSNTIQRLEQQIAELKKNP